MNQMVSATVQIDVLLNIRHIRLAFAEAVTAVLSVSGTCDPLQEKAKEGEIHVDIDRVKHHGSN
jgi:phage gp45-like